jgi:hypothetical protein
MRVESLNIILNRYIGTEKTTRTAGLKIEFSDKRRTVSFREQEAVDYPGTDGETKLEGPQQTLRPNA